MEIVLNSPFLKTAGTDVSGVNSQWKTWPPWRYSPLISGGVLKIWRQWGICAGKNGTLFLSRRLPNLWPTAFSKTLGNQGAHIACGEGQSLGHSPMVRGAGAGHVRLRKCQYMRNMPGTSGGADRGQAGPRRGFVLTLATREQHIRREKGDQQHLHQQQPLCPNSCHVHGVFRGERASGTWPDSITTKPVT